MAEDQRDKGHTVSEQTERFLKQPSEFGGKSTEATHGIQPDNQELDPPEQLRLVYRTGQDATQDAPTDDSAWTGG